MPRPIKYRKICGMPQRCKFGPLDGDDSNETVIMTLDEYETIRLIDSLGYNQEKCSDQMGVARTTVQAVYNSARKKLAQVLIDGKPLLIQGGNYAVCPNSGKCCRKKGCYDENCSYLRK